MSARDNLHSAIVIAAARGRCNEEGIAYVLDAFKDEVLREAAEKIRRAYCGNGDPLGRHATTPITNAMVAADLIDPDKEDQCSA